MQNTICPNEIKISSLNISKISIFKNLILLILFFIANLQPKSIDLIVGSSAYIRLLVPIAKYIES